MSRVTVFFLIDACRVNMSVKGAKEEQQISDDEDDASIDDEDHKEGQVTIVFGARRTEYAFATRGED